MKKLLLALSAAAVLMLPQVAGAEGFGIVEWSTEGVAMGGARMFAEDDAANIAYNPASITKVKGEQLKNNYTYLSPHGDYRLFDASGNIIEVGHNKVHAAWAPGLYYVKQMDAKNWFGIGAYSRFAMISEFENTSKASSNAYFSKLNGVSITPVYAHKFDKKWSAAVGAEINYVGLELQKNSYSSAYGMNIASTQTEGESYALGWNAAVNYAFDDKNEIGVVYRSRIEHSLEADFKMKSALLGGTSYADAYGCVTLPDSWDIGYNHKFNKKTRIEFRATRTNWSTYDALNIAFSNASSPYIPSSNDSDKLWKDGWRYAVGIEHKLSEKYALMLGYAYDESSIPYEGGDFMVPTGSRRTYSIGFSYNDDRHNFALAYGWMDISGLDFAGHSSDAYAEARTHDNSCKVFSIGWGLRF